MSPEERAALSAVRLRGREKPDDVWRLSEFHVPELHAEVRAQVVTSVAEAAAGSANSLGVAIVGESGAGKTHLLGAVRAEVQANGVFFFLIDIGHADSFWPNTALCLQEDLLRPAADAETQLKSFIRKLAVKAGVPVALHPAIEGDAMLTPEALNQFVAEIFRLDRQVGSECRDTARALVLYGSIDMAEHDIGKDYLLSMNEIAAGARARWGLRSGTKPAERIVYEMSRLLAMTGPSVIAVDQIDELLAPIHTGLRGTDTTTLNYASTQLDTLAGGIMALRQKTHRTLCVVSCLPRHWVLIEDHAIDTVKHRFRTVTPLPWIADPAIARRLVEQRLGAAYRKTGFKPDYSTWPVRPEAFVGEGGRAPDGLTPGGLFHEVEQHIEGCLRDQTVRELKQLGQTPLRTGSRQETEADDAFAGLDARFSLLCQAAEVAGALDASSEDRLMPPLLAAGFAAWIDEHADQARAFGYDPPPGPKPALHARLRRVNDEATGDETHWAFRAIASASPVAALHRLRSAATRSGLTAQMPQRHLYILRNSGWPRGAKNDAELAAVTAAGGNIVHIDAKDLRVFDALRRMREEGHPSLQHWLASRRHASRTALFSATLADAPVDPGVQDIREGDTPGMPSNKPTGAPPRTPGHREAGSATFSQIMVTLGMGATDQQPYRLPLESLRRHVAIFAGSGSGKTVLIRRLVEECALRGVSSIILDPNNDLARLGDPWPEPPPAWGDGDADRARDYLAHTDVRIWTPRRDAGCPLSFQPLPDFAEVRDDVDELAVAIEIAATMLEPRARVEAATQKAMLGRAVLREALRHHALHGDPALQSFVALLADLPEGVSQQGKAQSLATEMADALKAAMVIDPLFGGTGTPVDAGILLTPPHGRRARVSVISFVGLPSDEQRQSFVNQLQMSLFAWIKKHPAGDRPLGGLLVMDEAQTLAPSGAMTACTQSTLALASQARKYGLGLVFATQAPKGIHNRIPGNATTQLFGLLNAPVQIDAAREMARVKGGDVPDIARLQVGQFYAAAEGHELQKIQTPLCLTHHPRSPLTTEEVVDRARRACKN